MTTAITIDDLLDDWASEEHICPVCGLDMEWEDCWNGCEDGFFNLYDDDPLWYDEDDTEVCEICKGQGGYWVCPNAENHTVDKISNG